jgi:hypothetical protein
MTFLHFSALLLSTFMASALFSTFMLGAFLHGDPHSLQNFAVPGFAWPQETQGIGYIDVPH